MPNTRLNRTELQEIVGRNAKYIRAFEEMQQSTFVDMPDELAALAILIGSATAAAEDAAGYADAARQAADEAKAIVLPDDSQRLADIEKVAASVPDTIVPSELQGDGLSPLPCGFRGRPQNAQPNNYTLVADDAGRTIYRDAGINVTHVIPSNASVPFALGTQVHFINMVPQPLDIVVDVDTLYLATAGTTGTRQLAQYGRATAEKISATEWLIWGDALT